MTLITQLSRLSDLAYQAAEDGTWVDFLAGVAQVFDTAHTSLMTDVPDSGGGRPQGFEHTWGVNPSGWYPDPGNDQIMERTWQLPRGHMSLVQGLAEHNDYSLAEPYRNFLVAAGLNHVALVLLPQESGRVTFFCVTRTVSQPPFSDEEIETIEGLMPHLRRALRLRGRKEQPRENLFERSPYGLVLFDERGKCVAINEMGRDLLAAGDGIWSKGEQVFIEGVRDFPALVASMVGREGEFGPAILRIERRKTDKPLTAIVAPAPAEWSHMHGRDAAVIAILGDPEQSTSPEAEVLMAHYGLTRSEARLANALVEMRTLKAAGVKLGIAPETARHHIKAVFHKTRTHSQAELVRLLVRHPTALFGPLGRARPPIMLN